MIRALEAPRRVLLACSLALAGCAGAEPAPKAAAPPAPAPTSSIPVDPGAPKEPDTPAGFAPRVYSALPAPDARAAKEDLPAGTTCRIGSDRLAAKRNYGDVLFPSADRVLMDSLGSWTAANAISGAALEDFDLGWVTSGVSPSGTCLAVTVKEDIELFRMPGRESAAKRTFSKDRDRDVIPADDCSSAMQREGSGRPCVQLFGGSLKPAGSVCAGMELGAAALSNDGRRIALVPGRMSEHEYVGDGVHVFDTGSREEIAFVKRNGAVLGEVVLSRSGGLAAFVDGAEVRIVAIPSGKAVSRFPLPADTEVRGLKLSPAAKRLAVTLYELGSGSAVVAGLAVVDVATGRPLFTQRGLPGPGHVAFSPDGTRVAYVVDSGLRIVDTFTGEDRVAGGRLFHVESGALSALGDRAVVSSAGHLTVWDTRDCSRIAALPNQPRLHDLVVLPGGASAIGFEGTRVVRVDLSTGARTSVDVGLVKAIDSRVVSPDGGRVFVGLETKGEMRVVRIDVASMKELGSTALPGIGPIGALIFTPDGKSLYAAAPGGLAHGDSPMGNSSVIEIDPVSGAAGRRFQIPRATQTYLGAVLERGRVIVVNSDWRERLTGKDLPRPAARLLTVSGDHQTALWAINDGAFAWGADDPLPALPAVRPWIPGSAAVSRDVILQCSEQSCVVMRAATP